LRAFGFDRAEPVADAPVPSSNNMNMGRAGLAATGMVWLLALAPAGAGTIGGRVFLDANRNGSWDPGEQGVSQCVVSDERTLARSDGDGLYRLALPDGPAAVFVVNAPGTWPMRRWWTHVADGSANITRDFPLEAARQDGPLYFVQGTDPHIHTNVVEQYLRYIEHVNKLPVPVQFVVHTGDLAIDTTRASMERANELFDLYESTSKALGPPLRNLMGNHDIPGIANPKVTGAEPGFGKALYRQRLGPATYAFRHGPYHFIALDGTTVNDRTLTYGLTRESADWAIAYLAGVGSDEPIILMMHEPMFPELGGVRQPETPETRPNEWRLKAALQGKKLLMTLAGHVHGRSETTWAGAPHILGGAISYAWHGILPYPPMPLGYVLFRLEGTEQEHVYLDWAEERSIDIAMPSFTSLVRGRQRISGIVADLAREITGVECLLAGQTAKADVVRRGNLAAAFEMELDSSALEDGTYDLRVIARGGSRQWEERQPVVVANGRASHFRPAGGARLTFRLQGTIGTDNRILFNGQPLATVPPDAPAPRGLAFDVPAERLRRLNEIAIIPATGAGSKAGAVITDIGLEYEGQRWSDARYSPLARRMPAAPKPGAPAQVVAFIDIAGER